MGARKKVLPADNALNASRELFCRYYTQNTELFGNATLSYAEAFGYDLDNLDRERIYEKNDEGQDTDKVLEWSQYDKAYSVCGTESSKLLKKPEIQARMTALLNELLKDDVVDSQLAKLIQQDHEPSAKIAAIREYNKLRGRILDKSEMTHRYDKFAVDDIRTLLSPLPQERQDEVYAIITSAIAEAELLRSGAQVQSGSSQ